jgi:rSAM/selenodomain-associated transferase 1
MPDKPIILLFIKAPVKGRVKSRLASSIGEEAALEVYGNFIHDSIDTVEKSGYPYRICYYPFADRAALSGLPGRESSFMPQEGNDLGARMENAFLRTFAEGFTSAVLIGSDIPDLPVGVFFGAFDALKKNDVVIGPAGDGGYYLIGFNKDSFFPGIFHGMTWSTGKVFQETMGRLNEASLRVHRALLWKDVDTLDDLRALFERNGSTAFQKSKTMAYLAENKTRFFR